MGETQIIDYCVNYLIEHQDLLKKHPKITFNKFLKIYLEKKNEKFEKI